MLASFRMGLSTSLLSSFDCRETYFWMLSDAFLASFTTFDLWLSFWVEAPLAAAGEP